MLNEIIRNMSSGSFLFLLAVCFLAAFIDAISGGGGLISLPAYLASGIPAHVALGTNKVSACISTFASAAKFAKSGKVNWDLMKKIAIFSFIGASLGVKTVLLLDSKYLYPITIVLLVVVLIYTLMNKKMGEVDEFLGLNEKNIFYGRVMAFAIGFYDGFFGPGTGSFLIFLLISIFKLDFTSASGNAKVLNVSSNIASVALFIYFQKVNYFYAIPVGIVMVFGAILGSRMAVLKGAKFIKPIFLTMTSLVLFKMVAEAIFHVNIGNIIQDFFMAIIK